MPRVSNVLGMLLSVPVFLTLSCALFSSCATIMNPGPYLVPITSTPSGAVVIYRGAEVGTTPCQIGMDSKSSEVTLRLAGHHDRVADVGWHTNDWVFGNILIGGLVGLLIDLASGNSIEIDAEPVSVDLSSESQPDPGRWTRRPARREPDAHDGERFLPSPRGRY